MKKVSVNLGLNSYEIRVGTGLIGSTGQWLKELGFSGKAVIVTDSNVAPLYAGAFEKSLANAGFRVTVVEVPAGEEQKTLETAGVLFNKLSFSFTERSTPVVALGGGMVGDLAGFVAATYMRGVPLVQVPTSLLAMTDSSVGGKTAVDHGRLKNIVGAFYQPKMVIADIGILRTLPPEELSNGMAEVIKIASLKDRKFFDFLKDNMAHAAALKTDVLEEIVLKSTAHKAAIVGRDEKESGERIFLNYGHTIAHAIESTSSFKIKHGQAVALGMVMENNIAVRAGIMPEAEAELIADVIRQAGLPVTMPDLDQDEKEKVLEALRHDKKVVNNRIRFVLLKAIGSPVINDSIDPGLIKEVLFGRG